MPDEYGLQLVGLLSHAGIEPAQIDGICIASVVPPLTGKFSEACQAYLGQTPLVVGAGVKTGVRIRVDDPRTVGSDRVVDAVAVINLYGGPACVVDFGTATTFDAITIDGDYIGGAIAPSLQVGAEGLFERAAQLPLVEIQAPPGVIGRNTIHAMQSGLVYGYIALIEGMVARFREQLGSQMKVIATGGLAGMMSEHTDVIDVMAPWLTLDGLRIIWGLNR
jgi:type III pantothenate kinase